MPPTEPRGRYSDERRGNRRFALHFPLLLRPRTSVRWILSETINVSAMGLYFATDLELPRDEPVEYVLTFPPDLTHAPAPWRVRVSGNVVRVEPQAAQQGGFGVAVHTTKRRYLSPEELDLFFIAESCAS